MALCQVVSGRVQRPQGSDTYSPFTLFIGFCWYVYFYFPFKLLLMKNTRIRCLVVCRLSSEQGLNGVHITLHSHQYRTRSVDCFPTHLPSKTRSKCPRSRTWISIHQRYHHVCRIFSTDGHFQWPIHHYGFRTPGSVSFPIHHPPSYLCRWPRTL